MVSHTHKRSSTASALARLWVCLGLLLMGTQGHTQGLLTAKGAKIVDPHGNEIILRGVGLGGWVLQEGYMMKLPHDSGTQGDVKRLLYANGMSKQEVETFYRSWRDSFVTEKDIAFLAQNGFNAVRLPMHYELFLTAKQRAVRTNAIADTAQYRAYVDSLTRWYRQGQLFNGSTSEGFAVIDRLLGWCKKHHIYLILDLHAAPGGQGTDRNIADAIVPSDFWRRAIYQDATVALWKSISDRYKNEPAIAFYDLINEPNNVPENAWIHDIFDRLIVALRNNNDNHLLMVEGNGWGNSYSKMLPADFTRSDNLIYNAHRYWCSNAVDATDPNPNQINLIGNLVAFRNRYNVPVWVGETGENNNQWLRENIANLESVGIGWCHWTLKRFDSKDNAALMHIKGPFITEGQAALPAILQNIRFDRCVKNDSTIRAVAPALNR